MSEKFIFTLAATFFILTASFVVCLLIMQGGWIYWIWSIWFRVLLLALGLDFSLIIYIGWDYLDPKDSRLPIYLGLTASMLIALLYKGIALLIKVI